MEPILYMSLGAAGVLCLILMRLAAKHGWAWIRGQVKAHAGAAEADFKSKVSAAVGDLDVRIREVVHSELAKLESDIAALKAKVGGLS
jgi:hypothetical protein